MHSASRRKADSLVYASVGRRRRPGEHVVGESLLPLGRSHGSVRCIVAPRGASFSIVIRLTCGQSRSQPAFASRRPIAASMQAQVHEVLKRRLGWARAIFRSQLSALEVRGSMSVRVSEGRCGHAVVVDGRSAQGNVLHRALTFRDLVIQRALRPVPRCGCKRTVGSLTMRIEHVALWTDDLKRIVDFYTRYFAATPGAPYVNSKKGFESVFLT